MHIEPTGDVIYGTTCFACANLWIPSNCQDCTLCIVSKLSLYFHVGFITMSVIEIQGGPNAQCRKTMFTCACDISYVHASQRTMTRSGTQHIQTLIPLVSCTSHRAALFLLHMTSHPSTNSPSSRLESLRETEIFWRDNFTWFKDQGYQLRPRFAPDWIPSWKGTSKFRLQCEDGHPLLVSFLGNTHRNILIFMFPVRSSQ